MHLALYQPEIPQNVGTLARTGACLKVPLHLIGPLGFVLSNKHLQRAGMDYIEQADLLTYSSWEAFQPFRTLQKTKGGRLIVLSVQASLSYLNFSFHPEDILCAGSESMGLPPSIAQQAEVQLCIPMPGKGRSLNVAIACALVLGEALRQIEM